MRPLKEDALRKMPVRLGRLRERLKHAPNPRGRPGPAGPGSPSWTRRCATTPIAIVGAILCGLAVAVNPAAAAGKPDRIRVEYVPPKDRAHQPIYEAIKRQRALERVRHMLSPLRLPRILHIKVEGCDGVSNAWYDEGAVTVCYEYLDELWRNVPEQETVAGMAPIDALIGPLMDVFLHEAAHAVFDILQVPLFGREEDAADQFSAISH